MNKQTKEERPFPWTIADFVPVKVEEHRRGLILTNASGVQILRTHPGRVKIGDKYYRVPSQDYIVRDEAPRKIKDIRCER